MIALMGVLRDPDPEMGAAGRRWRRSRIEALCDEVTPWEHGSVLRCARFPDYWELNALRVEEDPGLGGADVIAAADRALADCRHRLVNFEIPLNARVHRELRGAGWRVTRLVWMHHTGVAPPVSAAAVEEVGLSDVRRLRLAWHLEDFPGSEEVERYLDQTESIARADGARVFAVAAGGDFVGYAQLDGDVEGAEVAQVYVHPDHRGAGLGTAVTVAAIRAGMGARQLWISADYDDRPQRLYQRLGFRPAWYAADAIRPPAAATRG